MKRGRPNRAWAGGLALALVAGPLMAGSAQAEPVTLLPDTGGTAYHVDCSAPSSGIGTEAAPIASLDALAEIELGPGDSVLLKRGTECTGQLRTQGSGAAGNPIRIDAYGDEAAAIPAIHGEGVTETVLLDNQEYIEVRNLEITNTDPLPADRFRHVRRGVTVKNTDAGKLEHFRLENLYIHDVTGQNKKDLNGSGGIQLEVHPGSVPSWFHDTVIANNRIEDVNRSGINMSTAWLCREEMAWDSAFCTKGDDDRNPWVPSTGLVIRDNTVDGVGGDGIVVQMNDGAVVEGNVVNDAANRPNQGSNAGVWAWNADNTLFQHNTVSNTKQLAGNNDGTSFDIDYGTRNTVFQYNVSYANEGGMVFFCGCSASWLPNAGFASEGVYRYNVTIAEQSRVGFLSGATDSSFYNNTVVITDDSQAEFLSQNASGSNVLFANNLVVSLRSDGVVGEDAGAPNLVKWRNNAFYSVDAASTWPGRETDGNQYRALDDLPSAALAVFEELADRDYLTLQGELDLSVLDVAVPDLAGAGIPMAEEGMTDLFGRDVPSYCAPDIGAVQFSSVDDEDCRPTRSLAAGQTTEVVAPALSTVRVDASVSEGATLTVTNARGFEQEARPGADGGVYAVVKGTATDHAYTVTCAGGECDDIAVSVVDDRVVDGSFESLFTAYGDRRTSPWTLWNTGRSGSDRASGEYSLSLTPGSTGAGSELRRIAVEPGATYELAGWARSTTSDPTNALVVGVKWGNGEEEDGNAVNAKPTAANSWQHVRTEVTVPDDVDRATVYCYQPAAPGTSLCDDVTMVRVSADAPRIVEQPRSLTVGAGDSAHLRVAVAGDRGYTVTWQESVDGSTWTGVEATRSGITTPVRSTAMVREDIGSDSPRYYRAVVTDAVTGEETVSEVVSVAVLADEVIDPGALVGLDLVAGPDRTVYLLGEDLELAGLVVAAHFENGTYRIAQSGLLTVDPTTYNAMRPGAYDVTVSYTADGVTSSTQFPVVFQEELAQTFRCDEVVSGVTATFHQTEWGTHPATLACDGSSATSWSTWKSGADRTTDTATFTFTEPLLLAAVELDWFESVPKVSATVQYQGVGQEEWTDLAAPVTGIELVNGRATSVVAASSGNAEDPAAVEAQAVRLVADYGASGSRFLKLEEVRFTVVDRVPASADAALGDLRVDGETIAGFDPEVTSYRAAWSDITAAPVVSAFVADPGAVSEVVQATLADPVATVTVQAADGTTERTYEIAFDMPAVTNLALDPTDVRTTYPVGGVLDVSGLVAVALLDNGQLVDVTNRLVVDAPALTAPGEVVVAVHLDWYGQDVSARFTITVEGEDPTEPGEDPTEPGEDPTEPGEDPTEPGTDPTEPGTDPTEPGTDPTEPGTDPTEPGTDPTEPGEDPTEPVRQFPATGVSGVGALALLAGGALALGLFLRRRAAA